jgi:hypothetical protein
MSLYVQYGAGQVAADGWVNFDASPTLRLQRLPLVGNRVARFSGITQLFPSDIRYGDVVKGLPLRSGSVEGLYASHVLEHLALDDMRLALRESLRILKPGGAFRLIVPDLRARAKAYVEAEDGDAEAAHVFLRSTYLGREERGRSIRGRLQALFGNSAHLWMFDHASMARELAVAGFVHIRRARFGDADDPMFARVESKDRFREDDIDEVAIEAKKPAGMRP